MASKMKEFVAGMFGTITILLFLVGASTIYPAVFTLTNVNLVLYGCLGVLSIYALYQKRKARQPPKIFGPPSAPPIPKSAGVVTPTKHKVRGSQNSPPLNLITCQKCGAKNLSLASICYNCKTRIPKPDGSPPSATATQAPTKFLIKCPHCGTELRSSRRNWDYCPKCAFPIGSAASYVHAKQGVPPSSGKSSPPPSKEPTGRRQNYYEILGIRQDATQKEIEDVYRALAKIYHSDHQGTYRGVDGDNKFKEINEAYQTLRDPELRARYNERIRPHISTH